MSQLFILLLSAWCSALVFGAPDPSKGSKVKVEVLYESLCPGCKQDMTKSIALVYKELAAYIDIHLYPFGNARMHNENGKVVVDCQHGPEECHGNKVHACAIDILKDPKVYVDYIACMMNGKSSDNDATECSKDQKIDVSPILKCANGDRGQELLVETGKQTEKFKNQYVPYVVLNGKTMDSNDDLKQEICKLLSSPPPACAK